MGEVTLRSMCLAGAEGYPVEVRASYAPGRRRLIVGLPPHQAKELWTILTGALAARGLPVPVQGVILEVVLPSAFIAEGRPLLPRDGIDLAAALAVAIATGQAPAGDLPGCLVVGGLGLDGCVRPVPGLAAAAALAERLGCGVLMVAREGRLEAAVGRVPVRAVATLAEALAPGAVESPVDLEALTRQALAEGRVEEPDLAEVRGLAEAMRTLEVAAAMGRNVLLVGPPGSGKTMLARRMGGLLPPLTPPERRAVLERFSVVGLIRNLAEQPILRPFRAPHHTVSQAGLLGTQARLGELALAHHGVLFLDEVTEFRQGVLDATMAALQSGQVHGVAVQPWVVAATNPCPCGWYGVDSRKCCCTSVALRAMQRRIVDLQRALRALVVEVKGPEAGWLSRGAMGETTAVVAARVAAVRRMELHTVNEAVAALEPLWRMAGVAGSEFLVNLLGDTNLSSPAEAVDK